MEILMINVVCPVLGDSNVKVLHRIVFNVSTAVCGSGGGEFEVPTKMDYLQIFNVHKYKIFCICWGSAFVVN